MFDLTFVERKYVHFSNYDIRYNQILRKYILNPNKYLVKDGKTSEKREVIKEAFAMKGVEEKNSKKMMSRTSFQKPRMSPRILI